MQLTSISISHASMNGEEGEAQSLVQEATGSEADVPLVQEMWRLSAAGPAPEVRRVANVPTMRTSVHVARVAHKRKHAQAAASADAQDIEPVRHSGMSSMTFPSLRRSRALEGDPQARHKAESQRWQRWLHVLQQISLGSSMPIVSIAGASQNPAVILSAVGQGRRAATLRRRALDWKRAARYFHMLSGTAWPRGPHDMLDYLNCLASSGAGGSALGRAVQALTFLERAGGVPQERERA